MRIGIHKSTSKSLESAARIAASWGANTLQIFSASPRIWKARPPQAAALAPFTAARQELDITPLIVHASYLINLGSADEVIRPKSIAAFRAELERCLALQADYLVVHPGNSKGQTREQGLANVAAGIVEGAQGLPLGNFTLLLENTAGSGHNLGSRFEELATIRDLAASNTELAIGYCLDTCHTLVSGYDLVTPEGFAATIAQADQVLGLNNIPVIHANDSKKGLGSHLDRHEHIGAGCLGDDAFARLLKHPALCQKAFILETPQDDEQDGPKNIAKLKTLCQRSSTTTA